MPRCCSVRSRPGRQQSAAGSSSLGPRPASAKADSGPIRLRECQRSTLPRRVLAGRCAGFATLDAVARPRSLARRRWSAVTARSARPESRLAAGLCARARALPRAGTGSSAVAADAAHDRRGDGALDGAVARGVSRRPGGGPPAGADLCADRARPHGGVPRCGGCCGWAARAETRNLRTEVPRLRRLVVGSLLVVGLAAAVTVVSSGPTSRLGDGIASGRYDLWRVAAVEFARQPIQGVGADNFAVGYARERHRREELLYPHSIEWRLLSQTGGSWERVSSSASSPLPWRPPFGVEGSIQCARHSHRRVSSRSRTGSRMDRSTGSGRCLHSLPRLSPCWGDSRERCRGPGRGPSRRVVREDRGRRSWLSQRPASSWRRSRIHCPGWRRGTWRPPSAIGAGIPPPHSTGSSGLDGSTSSAASRTSSPGFSRGVSATASGRARRFAGRSAGNPTDWYSHLELAVIDLQSGRRSDAVRHLEQAQRLNPLERSTRSSWTVARRNEPVPAWVVERLDRLAIASPFGRRPVDCRPVLGIAADCTERERGS